MFIKEGTKTENSAAVEHFMDIIYLPWSEQVPEAQKNNSSENIEEQNQKQGNKI